MKKVTLFLSTIILSVSLLSCERVPPNYYGVLMENYGKNGKSDYTPTQGRVNTAGPGTELFTLPGWEQRANFESVMHIKSSDNVDFTVSPKYTYKARKESIVDIVFENSRLDSASNFLRAIEDNILEPSMYDIIKEKSRENKGDTLMAVGESLKFEREIEKILKEVFLKKGFDLENFSLNLDYDKNVKDKINAGNESNSNLVLLDKKIIEQTKQNKLEELQTEQLLIRSRGLTPQILQEKFIEAWKLTKQPLYGNTPVTNLIQK